MRIQGIAALKIYMSKGYIFFTLSMVESKQTTMRSENFTSSTLAANSCH